MTTYEVLMAVALKATGVDPGLDPNEATRVSGIVLDIIAETDSPQQAALVEAVAIAESGLARDIDNGTKTGDSGRSVCIMQINVGDGKTSEGWTRSDLLSDRRKCIRAGLRHIRASLAQCRRNDSSERLAAYISGSCDVGRKASRDRVFFAQRIQRRMQ